MTDLFYIKLFLQYLVLYVYFLQKGFFRGQKLEEAADLIIAKKMCSRDLNIPLFEITKADLEEELTIGEDRGGRGGGRCSSYRRATFLQLNEMNSKNIFLSLSGFDITNNTVSTVFLNDCFGYHQIYIYQSI